VYLFFWCGPPKKTAYGLHIGLLSVPVGEIVLELLLSGCRAAYAHAHTPVTGEVEVVGRLLQACKGSRGRE
jgi:hypothetical protein